MPRTRRVSIDTFLALKRIAFAGVGRYNEFDQLRVAGVRAADLKGFQYSRDDVDARSLANQYAQMLGQIFTHEMKPMEVEILVAEVGLDPAEDQVFHILYDGSVVDEDRYSVIGGDAEAIGARLEAAFQPGLDLAGALQAAVGALAGPDRSLAPGELEVAVLSRQNGRRAFRRIEILERVSGFRHGDTSTVTVHVRRLREKVEDDPSAPTRIATVPGIGYRWEGST